MSLIELMSGRCTGAVILAALGLLQGCAAIWPEREGFVQPDGVFVFHAPGIAGTIPYDHAFGQGLQEGGVSEVRVVDWHSWWAGRNLSDQELHAAQAQRLIQMLRGFRATSPDARIVLTGHSGGARIVMLAAQQFEPAEALVEQVWLLAPALDPGYDFDPALDRVDRIVSVNSDHDWFVLGTGTRTFGTADRVYAHSGGYVGFTFKHPRFEQWFYEPSWLALGHNGDHLRVLGRRFAREGLAPAMVQWVPGVVVPENGVEPSADESGAIVDRAYNGGL